MNPVAEVTSITVASGAPRRNSSASARQHDDPWAEEYGRDIWDLRRLGARRQPSHQAYLHFDVIPQPWLKELSKRWARWRISTGKTAATAGLGTNAVTQFAAFLAAQPTPVNRLADIDRPLLERYLAFLHATYGGRVMHRHLIGQLNQFLTAIRQHGWDTTLPVNAMFFPEDYPKEGEWLPRALSDHVMAQLEHPDNLDRWNIPAYRLVTLILMRCGLRVIDALGLTVDCVVRDGDGAPYLRYFNHKMRREALVPIDDELEQSIAEHLQRSKTQWSQGISQLFPKPRNNPDGQLPMGGSAYRRALQRWLASCAIQDEHGQRIRITPHQWRHTLGTQLINRDVPQEVVRRILDHDSHMMTARYARLSDTTIRRHWEAARKVGITGETVTLDPDGPLAEAAWAKQRVGRATQALPNGYCSLPLAKTCPHANACLTCPMFVTTAEFLPQHRHHQQQVIELISSAEARGQQRLAEMNRQVLGNLTNVITTLENDPGTAAQGAPNAS